MWFGCECGDTECSAIIAMTTAEYDAVRVDRSCFVVVPGHVDLQGETVVLSDADYLVVKKSGVGLETALADEPKSPPRFRPVHGSSLDGSTTRVP